jgi:hypothetical protein
VEPSDGIVSEKRSVPFSLQSVLAFPDARALKNSSSTVLCQAGRDQVQNNFTLTLGQLRKRKLRLLTRRPCSEVAE